MEKTIRKENATIAIDNANSVINAVTNTGLVVSFKLGKNQNAVIKLNKTTISTCNVEMLAYAIEHNESMFNMVYCYITRIVDRSSVIGYTFTKSQFYSEFFTGEKVSDIVEFFNSASHSTRRLIVRDHMCDNHTAKMAGMISYSTLVENNPYCKARMSLEKAVCVHCFAYRQLAIYDDQRKKLTRAHLIATCCKWEIADIPFIDYKEFPYFRLESFGDLINTLQVNNYNTLAMVNGVCNGVMTTMWTKNPGIVQKAINDGMRLSNYLTIGLSSLELNTPELEKAKKYSFVKFLFTVYTPEFAREHNITINCGGLHCLSCLKCYELAANSDTLIIINEMLK